MAEALSGLTGSIQGTVTGLGNKGMQWLDSIFPPESRAKAMNAITKFSSEKPMLAVRLHALPSAHTLAPQMAKKRADTSNSQSFLASQIALSGFPLGLFMVMTISVAVFAVIVAIIFAVLGSVLFILFWVGVALIFLLPTLFVTTGIATFVWLWGVATYYILKHFNEKPIPGIHTSLKDGIIDNLGADNEITHQLADLTGQKIEGSGEQKGAQERQEVEEQQQQKKKTKKEGANEEAGDKQKGGMNGHAPDPKKAADLGKHAGKATDAASGAKDKASGATGTVTGVASGAKGAVGV